jgi:hypothetical protein
MRSLLLVIILLFPMCLEAQAHRFLNNGGNLILNNEKYGTDEKQAFDIILPQSDKPTALVIFIHGGGFYAGDKNEAYNERNDDIGFFLGRETAYATINYRFYNTEDSIGVGLCLHDIKTAVQYIRHNAKKYNIDKNRIAVYGISAGAGSSLYLAFHDDMAVKNDTTLLGESTRVRCAGAIATQATYNVFRWFSFVPGLRFVVMLKRKMFFNSIANFYGYSSYKAFRPQRKTISGRYDMLNMITPDDPPVYVLNLQKKRFPADYNTIEHHRAHALILCKIMRAKGVVNEVHVYGKEVRSENDLKLPLKEFMMKYLQ